MSEGTKLGESSPAELVENNVEQEVLQATKLGEISEFEKELFKDDVEEQAQEITREEQQSAVIQSDKKEADKDAELSEMERFLEEESMQIFDYQNGDTVDGSVRSVEKGGLMIDFGFKSDGFVSNSELGIDEDGKIEKLEAGQEAKFYIEKLETKEGYAILSRKKAQLEVVWDELVEVAKERGTVSIQIDSKVQGGLVASYKNIKGFMPASQVVRENDEGLEQYVGSNLDVSVLQADRRRFKVIFSNKVLKLRPRRDNTKIMSELEVGQTRAGRVTSIKDFGIFVDLGGVEGLVHISELSWSRVSHPSQFVTEGENVNVFVLGVDQENKKISLGMKQLEPDPWVEISLRYKVGDVVEGEITRIATFGAFIKIEDNIEGLIHISELSHDRIAKVEDVVKEGDAIKAKIIKLIPEEQKIGLSLKNIEVITLDVQDEQEVEAEASVEEETHVDNVVEEEG